MNFLLYKVITQLYICNYMQGWKNG